MTDLYEATEAVAAAVARQMIAHGWDIEDVAAAFVVNGVALSRLAVGDAETAEYLDVMGDYLHGAR